MTDLLTLPEARAALRLTSGDTSNDSDLSTTYIPAVTIVVEDITGPIITRTGLTWTVDGGRVSYILPSACTAVTSVTETGTSLVANVDYTVNLRSGIITRGSVQQPYIFLPGQQNVVITYNAGTAANTAAVAANVKLAARLILRNLWQSDQQGYRPAFGQPDTEMTTTPSGYAIPRQAERLLQASTATNPPGFA